MIGQGYCMAVNGFSRWGHFNVVFVAVVVVNTKRTQTQTEREETKETIQPFSCSLLSVRLTTFLRIRQ